MTSWLAAFDSPMCVVDLAHPLSKDVPTSASHVGFNLALKRRHGDSYRHDGGSGASEVIMTSTHVGTHIDALSHASLDGQLHGGIDAFEAQRGPHGFTQLGAETIPPIVGRALLLDVAFAKGQTVLPGGYEITRDDLIAASEGRELQGNTAILIRTGWSEHWGDPQKFMGATEGAPGVGVAAAEWLAELNPVAVGSDTMAFEHIPPGAGHGNLPVHSLLLVQRGIYIMENLALEELSRLGAREFAIVVASLPIVGGTGSPVRPLALVRDDE